MYFFMTLFNEKNFHLSKSNVSLQKLLRFSAYNCIYQNYLGN